MIERRRFGRTGRMSSAVIFGAAALWEADQGTADRVLDLLLEFGINHIDAAPRYGVAEERIGPWMDRHRGDFFLATKTRSRDHASAREDIRRSLDRLRTDRIDLIQLHGLTHPDQWEQALSPGGALDAAIEAREAGLVRFIGVTGHGWTVAAMHRRALLRFDFDSVLLPWNWHFASHEYYPAELAALLATCRERDVAVQTIKAIARGPWPAGNSKNRTTWYQPLEDPDDIATAVRWVLATPDIFLNSVGDVDLLPHVLQAAATPAAVPDEAAMRRLERRAGLASIFGI